MHLSSSPSENTTSSNISDHAVLNLAKHPSPVYYTWLSPGVRFICLAVGTWWYFWCFAVFCWQSNCCSRKAWVLCHIGQPCQRRPPQLTPGATVQASKSLPNFSSWLPSSRMRREAWADEKFYSKHNSQGLDWDSRITHSLMTFF